MRHFVTGLLVAAAFLAAVAQADTVAAFYQTITSGSTTYTRRAKLHFVGATVADDATNRRTTITVPSAADLALKAPLASPTFTGVVTTPCNTRLNASGIQFADGCGLNNNGGGNYLYWTTTTLRLHGGDLSPDASLGATLGTNQPWASLAAATVGPNSTNQHTLPAVTSDTVVLLAANQTLTTKTLTAPVINGVTSSGSTSIDFSGNSGTFKTTTGAVTIGNGAVAVTGAATFASTVTPSANAGQDVGTPTTRWRRVYQSGTIPTSTSFVFSSGWGSTCASTPSTCLSSITGDDSHLKFTVTSTGTGQGASPTITYTYKDGTWTNTPFCSTRIQACSTAADCLSFVQDAPTATTDVITYVTTPVAARTYTFQISCVGG